MLLDVGGYHLHADVHRPSQALHNVIFVHGLAGTGADWDPLRTAFGPHVRTTALDLIGHGASDAPKDPAAYTFPAVADALARVPDAVGARAPTWIGYSLGARLLLTLVLRHPDHVGGLVLVSAHPGLENDEQRRARIRQDQADARLLETQGVDAWLDQWHARPPFDARRGGPDWAAEVARKRQTNRAHALAHCLRGLGLGAQPSVLAALSGVAAPSLLVAGERDADYLRHAHTMASRMPVSAVRVIPGAGHGVPFEAPRRLREAVQSFLTVPTTS